MLGCKSRHQPTRHTMSTTPHAEPFQQPARAPESTAAFQQRQATTSRSPARGPEPAELTPQQPIAAPEPADPAREPYVFDLDGGRPCLDFANTLGSAPEPTEHLNSYADLVGFAAQSGLITRDDAEWLRAQGDIEPVTAAGVLTRARRLREALRTIFARLAAGKKLPDAELAVLNIDLAASLAHARVVPADGGTRFRWGWSGRNLDAPLWPIARSAADLLTSDEDRALVRQCGADDCVWLFIDNTRNRSRQWCSMQSCGNREKARRHYQRVRERRDARGARTGSTDARTASTGATGDPTALAERNAIVDTPGGGKTAAVAERKDGARAASRGGPSGAMTAASGD